MAKKKATKKKATAAKKVTRKKSAKTPPKKKTAKKKLAKKSTVKKQVKKKSGVKKKTTKKAVQTRTKKATAKKKSTNKAAASRKTGTKLKSTKANRGFRRFELVDGKSSKFWEIKQDGSQYTVRYGRIGTDGQSKTKDMGTTGNAAAEVEKLIETKMKKGYADAAIATEETTTASVFESKTESVRSSTIPRFIGNHPIDLADGDSVEIKGSARKPYLIQNIAGVYSCSCPAWRNQSVPIDVRTCKHIRKLRGDEAEKSRVGNLSKPRKSNSKISGPELLLAHPWDSFQDLKGWWMSEKLDGVRAYWDGKNLLSRNGNIFHAPEWFIKDLPSTELDGELWIERKSFQKTVSTVRRKNANDDWKQIKYVVFDAPSMNGKFEERLGYLDDLSKSLANAYFQTLDHTRCRGISHLQKQLSKITSIGGEGLMLREPASVYEHGRSSTLLKVKNFLDTEATVIDHIAGRGRHKGRMGALLVQLDNGTEFSVGTGFSDAQRNKPPAIGTRITFRYQELTDSGVPRFPSYLRIAK
ncbi:DNA ligase [Mariniblastus sp.]|nr:DNA ligase [Mariniblastus sp.]